MFKDFFYKSSIWTSQAEQLHLQFMKMMIKKLTLLLFFSLTLSNAQEQNEHAPPAFIKSVQFRGGPNRGVFPVVQLGEPVNFRFDDLNADEADYYYRIKYYNYDWTPSKLFKNEYMEGYDNLRIDD